VKNKPDITAPDEFEQQLSKQRRSYELLSPLGETVCHLRFTGPYEGNLIIWDAHLLTLAYYVRHHVPHIPQQRQFIEVGEKGAQGRFIRIGLNLPIIDEPVILKTLIMIRQYKRLAFGRHEFGELVHFPK
jgi:hypothetical protein